MKYCKATTVNHPVSVAHKICLTDFNALLIVEGHISPVPPFTNNEIVLNLDCVETLLAIAANRNKNRSMDCAFGIANDDKSVQLMVLVELKLNHQNPNHVKREQLEEKVGGSISALTNVIPIYANYIFLFRSDRKEEAKNRFFRMNPKIPNEYFVMDINELQYTFFK